MSMTFGAPVGGSVSGGHQGVDVRQSSPIVPSKRCAMPSVYPAR
jgi:hypothetical protein